MHAQTIFLWNFLHLKVELNIITRDSLVVPITLFDGDNRIYRLHIAHISLHHNVIVLKFLLTAKRANTRTRTTTAITVGESRGKCRMRTYEKHKTNDRYPKKILSEPNDDKVEETTKVHIWIIDIYFSAHRTYSNSHPVKLGCVSPSSFPRIVEL